MSDNTGLLIIKKQGKWNIYHYDADGDYENKIGEDFESLETAVEFANKWEKDYYSDFGGGVEYGLRIIDEDK